MLPCYLFYCLILDIFYKNQNEQILRLLNMYVPIPALRSTILVLSGLLSVTNIPLILPSLNFVHGWLIKSEKIVVLLVSPCLVPMLHLKNSVVPALVLTQEVISEYIANNTL